MIIVIRISGLVEIPKDVQETLYRMRLRKKYTAILLKETEENIKLLKVIRNFVAYGKINDETLSLLLQKRAKSSNKAKIEPKTIIEQLKNKNLSDIGIKPFFGLHPPRSGIDSKIHFPIKKGVLGDNKEKINDLVRRML
ncbi:MAG: uL30 family ribosomal protein [Nanoarchaeota archaeon]